MNTPSRQAFTLIELLVVIVIIAVLTSVALPVFNTVQLAGRKTQSLSNMRQLGTALLGYCADNNGALPSQGDTAPTWAAAAANNTTESGSWYNAIPRYANTKGLGDYATNATTQASYYTKASLFYVPAAKYPSTKLSAPLFAVAYNSKLQSTLANGATVSARLPLFGAPAETVIFQESGVPGETVIKGQKAYTNQAASYASRTAARYNGQTILTFADGHAAAFNGTDVVDPSTGKAYFPPSPTAPATIYWEVDPANTPN